jgi:hypothetical protein
VGARRCREVRLNVKETSVQRRAGGSERKGAGAGPASRATDSTREAAGAGYVRCWRERAAAVQRACEWQAGRMRRGSPCQQANLSRGEKTLRRRRACVAHHGGARTRHHRARRRELHAPRRPCTLPGSLHRERLGAQSRVVHLRLLHGRPPCATPAATLLTARPPAWAPRRGCWAPRPQRRPSASRLRSAHSHRPAPSTHSEKATRREHSDHPPTPQPRMHCARAPSGHWACRRKADAAGTRACLSI